MPVLQGGKGGSFKVVHLGRIGLKGDVWEGAGGWWERASKG